MIPFWLVITSYDLILQLGFAIRVFTSFLTSKEVTKIDTKSSQSAHEMYKFMNVCNLLKKKWKKKNKRSILKKFFIVRLT